MLRHNLFLQDRDHQKGRFALRKVKLPQEAPPEMIVVEVQQVEKADLEDFLKIATCFTWKILEHLGALLLDSVRSS